MDRLDHPNAARCIKSGGVVAYPTEGVWGLGCDPRNEAAVMHVLSIKQREVSRGMILIAADETQLAPFVDMSALSEVARARVRESWPGPNTWIVPASLWAPKWITGKHTGIAVRVSAHPAVIALCNAFGGALVSTSANLSGLPAVTSAADLDPRVLALIEGVVEGETGGLSAPTPIRDAATGETLRA